MTNLVSVSLGSNEFTGKFEGKINAEVCDISYNNLDCFSQSCGCEVAQNCILYFSPPPLHSLIVRLLPFLYTCAHFFNTHFLLLFTPPDNGYDPKYSPSNNAIIISCCVISAVVFIAIFV